MRHRKLFYLFVLVTILSAVCAAADFSFRGTFTDINQVQYVTFTVSAGADVVIVSRGYAGGTNSAGVLTPGGGFDPVLALFQGTGGSALLYDRNDDDFGCAHVARDSVNQQCYDVYLHEKGTLLDTSTLIGGLDPGTYTVALMNYANFAYGPTLADGFTNKGGAFDCFGNNRTVVPGAFQDCDGNTRTGDWALDIKGVDTAQMAPAAPTPLSITSDNASRIYGAANPAFTGSVVGLLNGDNITATYASSAVAASPVGNYSIVPTPVDPGIKLSNYVLTINNGVFTVLPAALTAQANDTTRFMGDSNPVFTGATNGVQNADNITASFTSSATPTSPAGTYPINATLVDPDGKLTNYNVTLVNGTLTVVNPLAVVSSVPNSGSGASGTFQLAFSDQKGFGDIKTLWVQIGSSTNYPLSCAISYDTATRRVSLINDAGSGWLASVLLGSATTTQNSQCAIDAASSSANGLGNDLTLTLAYTFKPGYSGTKNIYGRAKNKTDVDSGWQLKGTWTPNVLVAQAPTVVSVTPSSGSGSTQVFQYAFSTPNGFADVKQIWTQVGTSSAYPNSCAVLYTLSNKTLQLIRDDGNGWLAPIVLGTNTTQQNSQCIIDGATSTIVGAGNNVTLGIAYTFKPAYVGVKNVFGRAKNQADLDSGWQLKGTWTLP